MVIEEPADARDTRTRPVSGALQADVVAIRDAAGKIRAVPPDGNVVRTARALGFARVAKRSLGPSPAQPFS